ncbi:E3 ubiquitin-protein ligase PRT1 [Striga asiatica]|uniref:E3 ubiquitin-protein ligase PRT1 n=1 Tax=Striga asiatica TaxID=4170 RepID=A0A5A7PU24_STRAF|nr:E3 ubiquitin-protein ligase PRT1 [Striga asiatica]
MEHHQGIAEYGEQDGEEIPDEFQCCVCLDILYKPVVLACGHISCFWCVFKAMDTFQESHCPVCRNPFNHFPRICNLLHTLLLKLYPSAYNRRERQVAEEEKLYGHASPKCEGDTINSQLSEELSAGHSLQVDSNDTCAGDHSIVQRSSGRTSPSGLDATTNPTTSSSYKIVHNANDSVGQSNQVLLTDLQCAVCKELLCRPVVLNCGHVYCEACIDPHDNVCKCPVCESAHPNGIPRLCLILEHFLEVHFPEEYSARKEYSRKFQSASPSGDLVEKQEQSQCPPLLTIDDLSQLSDRGTKFHPGAGCDYCGVVLPCFHLLMFSSLPAVINCVEKIGFDLCESCYNTSSKLPGRFNQQHTEDHKFEVIQAPYQRNIIMSLPDQFDLIANNSNNNSSIQVVFTVPLLPNDDALENGVESTNSSDNSLQDLEDVASPDSSSNNG